VVKDNKILVVMHSADMAGAELALLDTLDAIVDDLGMVPHFIMPRSGKLHEAVKERGWGKDQIEYDTWARPGVLKSTEDLFRTQTANMKAIKGIERVIDTIRPSIVLTNSIVIPWGAIAAGLKNIPHAWYVHEYGDIDHGLKFDQPMDEVLSDINRLSDLVIANSKAIESHLSKHIEPSKIITSYIPYNFDALEERSKVALKESIFEEESLKIVITGRITPSKGQIDAVKAVGELLKEGHKVNLCMIGAVEDENYKLKIDKYIINNNLTNHISHIKFTYNPFPYVKSADIGLNCSPIEAYGRVTFEYAALGLPVIGVNAGGTAEIVLNGQTGYTYEQGNYTDLKKQIKKYIKSPRLIKTHGKQGALHTRKMMEGDYSVENLSRRLKLTADQPLGERKLPYYTERLVGFGDVAINYSRDTLHLSLKLVVIRLIKHTTVFRILRKIKRILVRSS